MKNIRRSTFAALAIVMLSIGLLPSGTAFAQNKSDDIVAPAADSRVAASSGIEGVWNVRVKITACATGATILSFDAMAMYNQDGTFHDTNTNNPASRSSAFGRWVRLDDSRYYFVFRVFSFDASGNNTGSQIVRHYVTLSTLGRTYTSAGNAQFFDANGNLTSTGCSSSTATRMEL